MEQSSSSEEFTAFSTESTSFDSNGSTRVTVTAYPSSDDVSKVEDSTAPMSGNDSTTRNDLDNHISYTTADITETNSSTSEPSTPKKTKPRVLKVKQEGIYTIKTLESSNFLREWSKGLRISSPY